MRADANTRRTQRASDLLLCRFTIPLTRGNLAPGTRHPPVSTQRHIMALHAAAGGTSTVEVGQWVRWADNAAWKGGITITDYDRGILAGGRVGVVIRGMPAPGDDAYDSDDSACAYDGDGGACWVLVPSARVNADPKYERFERACLACCTPPVDAPQRVLPPDPPLQVGSRVRRLQCLRPQVVKESSGGDANPHAPPTEVGIVVHDDGAWERPLRVAWPGEPVNNSNWHFPQELERVDEVPQLGDWVWCIQWPTDDDKYCDRAGLVIDVNAPDGLLRVFMPPVGEMDDVEMVWLRQDRLVCCNPPPGAPRRVLPHTEPLHAGERVRLVPGLFYRKQAGLLRAGEAGTVIQRDDSRAPEASLKVKSLDGEPAWYWPQQLERLPASEAGTGTVEVVTFSPPSSPAAGASGGTVGVAASRLRAGCWVQLADAAPACYRDLSLLQNDRVGVVIKKKKDWLEVLATDDDIIALCSKWVVCCGAPAGAPWRVLPPKPPLQVSRSTPLPLRMACDTRPACLRRWATWCSWCLG